jgi:Stage II sporulation protein E (SpoIIE)
MRRAGLMLFLILCAANLQVHAQAPKSETAATPAPQPGTPPNVPLQVALGESTKDLNGPWKFHTGDDMAWAQKEFDDSGWKSVDLTKPVGWTRQGYPGYSGYAWYRLRVEVHGSTHRLALKMPQFADDAYQVYVNGQLVGQLGKFSGTKVTAYPGLPEGFPFPKGVGNGEITIAIRMWMDSATVFNSPDAGGLHGAPALGYNSVITSLIRLDYDDLAHQYTGSGYLEALILVMALLMAVALFWLDREDQSYLWLSFVCAVTLLGIAVILSVNYAAWLGQTIQVIFSDIVITPVRIGLWVLFWGYWFRIPKIARLHRVVWLLVALLMAGYAMVRPPLYGLVIPVSYGSALITLTLVLKLGLGVLLAWVAYRGFTTQKTEGWMAGSAVLLVFVANYQHELRQVHVRTAFSVLGFSVSLGTLSAVASLLIITVMQLRRFIMAQVLKEQWKMEIQQAQEVQQLLIPAELPEVAGMTIESEYRPAREVGGDFFQIIPLETPGSVLIVLGDVTGKGMQAGMLVALIVGAIRGALMHSTDPARILYEVNEQLCERQHAIATCLILRIDPDGTGIIANAGQLAPYLNGTEIEMEGAFPIGIVPDGDFAITSFALTQGDNLFLMSDGVVEATDPQGALFGFDRIAELLQRHATSQEIAVAAQQFGQEDDILVLQVRRNVEQQVTLNA